MNKKPKWKTVFLSIVVLLLISTIVFLWSGDSSARPLHYQQTWPTRTPTSPSSPPTEPPTGGQPTNEPPGDGTETPPEVDGSATPDADLTPILLAPTPVGGYLPTAEPCGLPPTVLALAAVNVREGPGLYYEVSNFLVYLEVRPIIGRAADAAWWLIVFPDDSEGWVFDQAVIVDGYTSNVPIVPAPPIDGSTPTPGSPWQPTPNPICTPLPTSTHTPTAEATAVGTRAAAVPPGNTSTSEPSTPTGTFTPTESAPADTPAPEPTRTAESTSMSDSAETISDVSQSEATPSEIEESSEEDTIPVGDENTSGVSWLLVGGVVLIAAAVVIWLIRKR
jgi:hypothetical protein